MRIVTNSPYGNCIVEIKELIHFKASPVDKFYLTLEIEYIGNDDKQHKESLQANSFTIEEE